MPHFGFLQAEPEWREVFTAAAKAEAYALPDARTGCFYARRALELAVQWLYRAEPSLKPPYDDNLATLINEPAFRNLVGQDLYTKIRIVKDLGNEAVHRPKPLAPADALDLPPRALPLLLLARPHLRSHRRRPSRAPTPL